MKSKKNSLILVAMDSTAASGSTWLKLKLAKHYKLKFLIQVYYIDGVLTSYKSKKIKNKISFLKKKINLLNYKELKIKN